MTDESLYNLTKTSTKEAYPDFYKQVRNINSLCDTAEGLIRICAEGLCDVTALLPEMAKALPTYKQWKEARKLIQKSFI